MVEFLACSVKKKHGNDTPTCIPKSDLRAVIQFLTLENVPGFEIHCRLCAAYKDPNIMTKSTVNR